MTRYRRLAEYSTKENSSHAVVLQWANQTALIPISILWISKLIIDRVVNAVSQAGTGFTEIGWCERPGSVAETWAYRLKSLASTFQATQLSTKVFSSPARRA